jgi:PTS system mannose-specific IIA component
MFGILVISHGRLAEALISSVQFLVGNLKRVKGISIWPRDRIEEIKDRIQKGIGEVDDEDGVESSEKLLHALSITQISKDDYADFHNFSMCFVSV